MKISQKIFLSTKDVQALKGDCGNKKAIQMIQAVRKKYNVPERQQITVDQFCSFYNISETLVLTAINNGNNVH